ncbi:MAG: amidohydrolase [Planctomycetota bacterium]|jgi:predicted amidohydrolase YtcJ
MSTPRLGISSLLLGFLVACTAPPADPGTTPQGTAEKGTAREAAAAAEPADLVLRNGKIVTADDKIGTVEALAARDDRIVQVGTNVEIAKYVGDSTKVIDLKGKLAIPGFIEGHGLFTGLGRAKQVLDLMDVRNWDEIVAMVADAVSKAQPGEWITGRGWHQEKWDRVPANGVEGFPHHNTLSAVSPDNPVALTHASGHASFYNKKAMDLSGITKNTKDPRGGEIIRDANGEPIGVFRERAQGLVSRGRTGRGIRRSPEERREALRKTIQLADQECLANGVTSFQDAGAGFGTINMFKAMVDQGQIGTRLWIMIRASNAALAGNLDKYRMVGYGNNHLTVRAIKVSIDGALGPRGAWMLEPYKDLPNSTGLNTVPLSSLAGTARVAMQHDCQLCVHAIGDRANREVLNVFEEAFKTYPDKKDVRWRVEHAQHLHPDDIPRFGKLGVIASMQGVHCTSDAVYVMARLGEQRAREGAYVWQSLMKTGALVTNGSDAPVERISPIESFYATVTRRLKDGRVFFPEQRMSRMEALKSYTIICAKAAFEEDIKGTLVPGKLADVVVLSKDIMSCPEKEILEAEVVYTIVGAKVLYEGR